MQRCNAEIDWNCKLIWGRLNTLCFRFSFAFAFAFFRFVSYLQRLLLLLLCRCCRRNSARYWALQVRTKHADNNNNSNSNMRERQLRWLRRRRRQLIGNWAHETCCVGNNNNSNTHSNNSNNNNASNIRSVHLSVRCCCCILNFISYKLFWQLTDTARRYRYKSTATDTDTSTATHEQRGASDLFANFYLTFLSARLHWASKPRARTLLIRNVSRENWESAWQFCCLLLLFLLLLTTLLHPIRMQVQHIYGEAGSNWQFVEG